MALARHVAFLRENAFLPHLPHALQCQGSALSMVPPRGILLQAATSTTILRKPTTRWQSWQSACVSRACPAAEPMHPAVAQEARSRPLAGFGYVGTPSGGTGRTTLDMKGTSTTRPNGTARRSSISGTNCGGGTRLSACQGWRVNPFFLPEEVAAELSR